MGKAGIVWGTLFVLSGLVIAFGLLPGSSSWAPGPRIGITTVFFVFGLTLWSMALVPAFLRKTTKPADYKGGCPVGATCGCGHFNFKPRASCKSCGATTNYTS